MSLLQTLLVVWMAGPLTICLVGISTTGDDRVQTVLVRVAAGWFSVFIVAVTLYVIWQ